MEVMEEKRVVAVVGAHMDDAELAVAGTLQRAAQNGFETVVLVISVDPKRVEANKQSAQLLGYTLVLGDIPENEIDIVKVQSIVYEKLTRPYGPRLEVVFLHLPEDYNHHHRFVSQGSLSACRGVKNVLYFPGPGAEPSSKSQVGILFGEAEMEKKLEAAQILKRAYHPTDKMTARYFTREYLMGKANFWGQWFCEFEREKTPQVSLFGQDQLPYAEVFQMERLRMCFDGGKTTLF